MAKKLIDWKDVDVGSCVALHYAYPRDDGSVKTKTRYLKKLDEKGGARFVADGAQTRECDTISDTVGTVVAGAARSLDKKVFGINRLLSFMGKAPIAAESITLTTAPAPTKVKKAWNPFQEL